MGNIDTQIAAEKTRFAKLYDTLCINDQLMHVGLLLRRAKNNWPHNTIVICNDEQITYQQLYDNACILAQRLKKTGVKPNDRVIILFENSIEFYIAYFAVWHAGAIVAPLNAFLTKPEILKIIENAEPSAVIISPTQLQKITDITTLPPLITDVIFDKHITTDYASFDIPDRDVEDTAALLYTSGTTGFPKGVMLTSKNIIINTIQGISRFETSQDERVYCALPLFHSFPQNTCVWTNVVLGSTAIIVHKIDRHSLLDALKHQPTIIVAVPALWGLFCKFKTIKFGNIRYFFSGGDALSDKVRMYFQMLYNRKLSNGYGLTETSPFVSVDTDDYTQQTSTIGRPFLQIECQIRSNEDTVLEQGSIGILWIKGPNIMKGYYKAPEATAAVLKDGWFNSGDLGYIDSNGKIVITGREKDLIINKGINIYPQEIENVLLSNELVIQAAVIGKQIDHEEEIPVAFVASATKQPEELIARLKELCKKNLAAYKIPREWYIRTQLPMTATGKIDKKQLKKEL